MNPRETKPFQVNIRLSKKDRSRLTRIARLSEMSESEVIRMLIRSCESRPPERRLEEAKAIGWGQSSSKREGSMITVGTRLEWVDLVHPWTKEVRTVPVEVVTATYIVVRWTSLAGTYVLSLRKNELRPGPFRRGRKDTPILWRAADIAAVRREVKVHLEGVDKKQEAEEGMRRHVASMPGKTQNGDCE